MNIGQPFEIVEIETPAIPFEGDEVPEEAPARRETPEPEPQPAETVPC